MADDKRQAEAADSAIDKLNKVLVGSGYRLTGSDEPRLVYESTGEFAGFIDLNQLAMQHGVEL